MIVEFSVKNFRSIRDLQTISFVATKLDSNPKKFPHVDENNIAIEDNMRLLKTIGIYGANASGKSNIILALKSFLQAIKNEVSSESNLNSLCDPYLYQENYLESESFFQIVLIVNRKKYRYGFTVKKNPNYTGQSEKESKELVTNEWLYGLKEINQGEYFKRIGSTINKDKLPNKEKIPDIPSPHVLFLTYAAAFDKESICSDIRNFLSRWTLSNSDEEIKFFRATSISVIETEARKKEFLDLFSAFNLKYDDIIIDKDSKALDFSEIPLNKIFFQKQFKNRDNKNLDKRRLNLGDTESAGTQKLFDLAGLLLRAFNGSQTPFLILDEIDSNFHPSLLIKLIGLFNNKSINRSNAQLLFTSHDTNLMDPSIMRRDQFYFTEKDENYATRLYSLADLKGIRNDADFAKQYLAGFYGALPILEEISNKIPVENDRALGS